MTETFVSSIYVAVVSTLIITIAGLIGARPLLRVLQTSNDLLDQATVYLMVVFAGAVGTMLYNWISAVLRSLGNSVVPLVFLIISSVLNVILDIAFVVWIPMGVAGAAFATVLAQLLSGIGCLVYAWKILPILRFTKEELRCDRELVKQMLIYGVPTGLQMSIISVSDMTLQAMVNTYGTALIVAYGVCIKVEGVGWQMAEAIGTSLGTFTGQNVGANHLDRVKQGVRCAYLMNAVCYGIFCPVIWFFARPIMEAFTGNPESIRYGVEYMKIFSCFFFVGGILVVYHNILRSAGDVTITVLMGVSEIITRIGCTFLFTAVFGYYGLWWVSPLTGVARCWLVVSGIIQENGKRRYSFREETVYMVEKENQRWNTVIMKFRQEVRCLLYWGINGCRITEGRLIICIFIIIWKLGFAIMGKAQLLLKKKTYPLTEICLRWYRRTFRILQPLRETVSVTGSGCLLMLTNS